MKKYDENRYNDIINLPHHVSQKRKKMTLGERAAQFAPFAALTGHEDAVKETARVTEMKHELTEDQIEIISEKINIIKDLLPNSPHVEIKYFKSDQMKSGGKYVVQSGYVAKVLDNHKIIEMEDKTKIYIKDIDEIYSDCFKFDYDPK